MRAPDEYFRETHMIGSECREQMLNSDHFPVLRNAPFIWLGYSELVQPYRIVRNRSVHSHIIATIGGLGRTVIDGELVDFAPGQVMLGPVGKYHAFEPIGDEPWRTVWVFFDDVEKSPVLRGDKVELIEADTTDFVNTLMMLIREAAGAAQPAAMSALVTLLDVCARRMAGGEVVDERLWRLWMRVESDPAHDWNVAEMAAIACMSEEHLRRLCNRFYQHSPAEHLMHIRMRRAATMLRSSQEPVDEIALRVGYSSMYSFSTAFRRWGGIPPSVFRR